jgi:hypothetical protein
MGQRDLVGARTKSSLATRRATQFSFCSFAISTYLLGFRSGRVSFDALRLATFAVSAAVAFHGAVRQDNFGRSIHHYVCWICCAAHPRRLPSARCSGSGPYSISASGGVRSRLVGSQRKRKRKCEWEWDQSAPINRRRRESDASIPRLHLCQGYLAADSITATGLASRCDVRSTSIHTDGRCEYLHHGPVQLRLELSDRCISLGRDVSLWDGIGT